jgi:hypothetical protein
MTLVSMLALGSACSDFVEGGQPSPEDDEGTTSGPSGITLTTTAGSVSTMPAPTSSDATSSDVTSSDPTGEPTTNVESSSTTEPDDSGSTSDPSAGSSESESSSGTVVEAGFLDCLNDGKKASCSGAEMCIFDIAADPSVGVCAGLDCADVSDCPDAPPGGDAPPACMDVAVPDGNECILDCSAGQTCPTGMMCFIDMLCVWPQEGLEVEDFESGDIPPAWTLHDEDGNTPAKSVSFIDEAWIAAMTGSGDWVAMSTSWYSPAGAADDWLVTPAIAVSDASVLTFEARSPDVDFPDGYEVRISTTGPSVADFMANDALLDVDGEDDDFVVHTIDLAAAGYVDQIVWLAWRNDSDDQYVLQVDDIAVSY